MKQPEALRLADALDCYEHIGMSKAAAELRRLHEENQAFLNVLSWIADQTYDPWTNGAEAGRVAKFAVEKATKE
jgi:hypothetical protein